LVYTCDALLGIHRVRYSSPNVLCFEKVRIFGIK